MNNKVLVVGTVRNCSKTLRKVIRTLERELLAVGRDPEFFLVESDSDDSTVNRLQELSNTQANFRFVSLGNLKASIPDRVPRIAFCRNRYLEELERLNHAEDKFNHLVVSDFDEVNSKIQFPGKGDWLFSDQSVFTANQFGRYYDVFALRAPGWVEEDYRLTIQKHLGEGARPLQAYLQAVSQKQVHIQPLRKPFEVQSAFGGLAIYPTNVLEGLRYAPQQLTETLYVCEHVSLSKSIWSKGIKVMIAPSLRNKGSLSHTFSSIPIVLAFLKRVPGVNFWGRRL